MTEKEIAKEILITMIQNKAIIRSEHPGVKSTVELMCQAYKQILETVKEG